MANLTRGRIYHPIHDIKWSGTEKVIARKAFDRALKAELQGLMSEAKSKAAGIKQPSDLWDLEFYLGQRRKEIDEKYDYRYSVLPLVFGRLLREGRLTENELSGLGENKIIQVRERAS